MNIRQEKWLLAAAVVVFPLSAFAQPGYDNTSALRILSDPAYLPFAGQIQGTTAYHYDQASGDVFDSTGAPDYTFHTITNTISQSLQYGLTDDLSFQFGITYDPSQKRTDIFPDGSMKSLQSNGFTDPSFGVTWRAIDQANGPMNLDLSASYDPDAFNAKSPSPSEDGSIARGGQSAHFGGAISEVMPQFTVLGQVDANFFGSSDVDYLTNDTIAKRDSYWTYDFGVQTQGRITNQLSVNAGLTYTVNPSFNVVNVTNGNFSVSNPGDTTSVNAALNYHIVPNTVVVGLTYDYQIHGSSENTFSTLPAATTTTRNDHENIFGVRLQYVL